MKKIFFILILITIGDQAFAQRSVVTEAFKKYGIDENILDPKLKERPGDLSFDYKYTTVSDDKEKVLFATYDPSKQPEERWSLVSVNGKDPSASDLKKFRKTQSKAAQTAAGTIDETSMKVEKETAEMLQISYKVTAASLPPESSFLKDCRNYLTINLKTKRLEKLQCLNEKPVKINSINTPKLDFVIRYSFNDQMQRYLPDHEDLIIILKLLGQQIPMETIIDYSNYRIHK